MKVKVVAIVSVDVKGPVITGIGTKVTNSTKTVEVIVSKVPEV